MSSDDRSDDFERGLANRRAALGDAWVEQSLGNATAFNADFQSLITRYAWHEIWGRPGLDQTTRRLLVLGMTMGMARWEEFELHCRAAVRGGVPIEKIQETLLQGAIYCGVPAANTGFKIAAEILKSEGRAPAAQPLTEPMRVRHQHTFSAPQLHVTLEGSGPPVVLSHALGLDVGMWDALATRLARSYSVLRYEHRGHGSSAAPAGPYTQEDLVADAARVVREWGRGPVAWIGLSMGGMVGQGLAVRHPELVRGLVVANSTARFPAEARTAWQARIDAVERGGMAAVADSVIERYLSAPCRASRPELVAALRRRLLSDDAKAYTACCAAVAAVDWLEVLGQIAAPTLVIAGEADLATPPAMSQQIVDRIPGARLALLEGVAHLSAVEAPDRFAEQVEPFLAALFDTAGGTKAAPP